MRQRTTAPQEQEEAVLGMISSSYFIGSQAKSMWLNLCVSLKPSLVIFLQLTVSAFCLFGCEPFYHTQVGGLCLRVLWINFSWLSWGIFVPGFQRYSLLSSWFSVLFSPTVVSIFFSLIACALIDPLYFAIIAFLFKKHEILIFAWVRVITRSGKIKNLE